MLINLGNKLLTVLILILGLQLPTYSIPIMIQGEMVFTQKIYPQCDSNKNAHILVQDIIGRVFDIKFNTNMNACITTEHYLNGNLTAEQWQKVFN